MRRIQGFLGASFLAAVGAAALTPGCSENNKSLYITGPLAPRGSTCEFTADPKGPYLLAAQLDLKYKATFTTVIQTANQMPTRSDPGSGRIESHRVFLNGAVVRIRDDAGGQLDEYTQILTDVVDPASGTTAGLSVVALEIALKPELRSRLLQQIPKGGWKLVVADLRVFGRLQGGLDVESGEYQLPIKLYNDSLVEWGACDVATKRRGCVPTPFVGCEWARFQQQTPCSVCENLSGEEKCLPPADCN